MYLLAQCLLCLAEYLVVVEGQLRHFVQRKPAGIGCIIASLHLLHPHQSIVCNGDDTLTRIAIWRSEGMELADVRALQACLFAQLAQRSFLGTLVHLHKSTGERPATLVGFYAALHQQHT